MTEQPLGKIRPFKAQDIDRILEIERQAYPKTAFTRNMLLSYHVCWPDTFVVVVSEQEIVGYIIFDLTGHIYSMAVEPCYRRRGYGKMLFDYALQAADQRLWLEVRSKNRGAIDFYLKMGMIVVDIVKKYYGDDNALVMVFAKA